MIVAERIRQYLHDHGISQTFLSDKTGIDYIRMNRILNGQRKIQIEEYQKICGVLNVSLDEFVDPGEIE